MKRKLIFGIIIGMFLIGAANASLVSFLSNKVEGSVNVLGLDFYANTENELTLNEPSDNIVLTEIGEDGNAVWKYYFDNELDFYDMNLNVFAQARAVMDESYEGNETTAPVQLEFGYLDGNSKNELCNKVVDIEIGDSFNEYEISCENVNCDFNVAGFYYRIISNGENVGYKVQLSEAKTKVEVRGANN